MAKLIMWNLTTLDGYVEGPGRDISWHNDVWGEELERLSIEQGNAAGALMFGRITYELMAGYWPTASGEIADFMNALPKFVFSRTLKTSDWNNTKVFGADVPATVAKLKRETAKDIYLFGSADLASTLIAHGLIDEFRIGRRPGPAWPGHAAVQAVKRAPQAEASRRQGVVGRRRYLALRAGLSREIFNRLIEPTVPLRG